MTNIILHQQSCEAAVTMDDAQNSKILLHTTMEHHLPKRMCGEDKEGGDKRSMRLYQSPTSSPVIKRAREEEVMLSWGHTNTTNNKELPTLHQDPWMEITHIINNFNIANQRIFVQAVLALPQLQTTTTDLHHHVIISIIAICTMILDAGGDGEANSALQCLSRISSLLPPPTLSTIFMATPQILDNLTTLYENPRIFSNHTLQCAYLADFCTMIPTHHPFIDRVSTHLIAHLHSNHSDDMYEERHYDARKRIRWFVTCRGGMQKHHLAKTLADFDYATNLPLYRCTLLGTTSYLACTITNDYLGDDWFTSRLILALKSYVLADDCVHDWQTLETLVFTMWIVLTHNPTVLLLQRQGLLFSLVLQTLLRLLDCRIMVPDIAEYASRCITLLCEAIVPSTSSLLPPKPCCLIESRTLFTFSKTAPEFSSQMSQLLERLFRLLASPRYHAAPTSAILSLVRVAHGDVCGFVHVYFNLVAMEMETTLSQGAAITTRKRTNSTTTTAKDDHSTYYLSQLCYLIYNGLLDRVCVDLCNNETWNVDDTQRNLLHVAELCTRTYEERGVMEAIPALGAVLSLLRPDLSSIVRSLTLRIWNSFSYRQVYGGDEDQSELFLPRFVDIFVLVCARHGRITFGEDCKIQDMLEFIAHENEGEKAIVGPACLFILCQGASCAEDFVMLHRLYQNIRTQRHTSSSIVMANCVVALLETRRVLRLRDDDDSVLFREATRILFDDVSPTFSSSFAQVLARLSSVAYASSST